MHGISRSIAVVACMVMFLVLIAVHEVDLRGSSAGVGVTLADTLVESGSSYSDVPHVVRECTIETGRFMIVGDLVLPTKGGRHPIIVLVWGSGPAGRERMRKPSRLVTLFLESGFGVFIEDKPGSGESTGEFTPNRLLHERAGILAAELTYLRGLSDVFSSHVGVYGSSQAGYVIALALAAGAEIDFMVAVSCPTVSSVEQSAYLVEQQVLCSGYSSENAAEVRRFFVQRHRARSYEEYLEAAGFLNDNPVIRDDLGWAGVRPKEDFAPLDDDWEGFYDPGPAVAVLNMPVLAIFGEKDTQIDPRKGAETYAAAKRSSGNPMFRVVTIPGVDHNIRPSETGCMSEQRMRYGAPGGREYAPEFLEFLGTWLYELGKYLEEERHGD